ncbi:MAG: heme-binding protein [Chloroflexota bacterium]|nr:MAG: heme-binding protein [Chloroflexota bacterium]
MAITIEKRSIDLASAQGMVMAAIEKAREIGVPSAVAVCDESGILKAFARMDGAALLAVRLAKQKALSSVGFGMPTHGYYEAIKDDPSMLTSLPHQQDMVVFGGGYPIVVDGQVVGAIGVSGGHYTQDQQVALAGLATIEVPVE